MQEADMMVLNSCAVTAPAASDSRAKVRQAERAGVEEIVVTGCWSTLEPIFAAEMPGVTRIVPNAVKDNLVSDLLQIEISDFDLEPIERAPIPGQRLRTRAFIKVQDGCDNRCTFCVTTMARGESRSRPVMQVVSDVRAAVKGGAMEIVLTGVHLGSWGYDFDSRSHLSDLIRNILEMTIVPRLRVSSLEPWDLDQHFFALWQDKRMCRHLHLPLQSGSAATLRRMARKTSPGEFAALVEAARAVIPDVAITTDVIAGFPGETDEEFAETLVFVEEMQFAGAHIFTYSARPGTAAAAMPNQVHNATRKERSAQLRSVVADSNTKFRQRFVGQELSVLWENVQQNDLGAWDLDGLSDNYIRVEAQSPQPLWNQITNTYIQASNGKNLIGTVDLPSQAIWFMNEKEKAYDPRS
jgi:threonylcarbamoyladenosine tRNA methylthiotransferase MtaB